MNKVAITRCQDYEYKKIREALISLFDNSDFPDVNDKSILIKPNILSDSEPEKNITTNPIVVKTAVDIIKEKGARKIYIGDSPGFPGAGFSARTCGIAAVAEETGSTWVDFSKETETHTLYNGIKAPIAKILFEVDLVFSICKMKTHQLMYATGAVKNMFGVIPGLNKSPLHLKARSPENFALFLLSLYNLRRPDYSIMDGIISMEGAGPANGDLRNTGLLLASNSALALDKAEAIIMGYDPKDIPILYQAERMEKNSTRGEYPLLMPEELVVKDFKRVPIKKRGLFNALILPFFTRLFDKKKAARRKAPEFDSAKCRLCKRCIGICPAKALRVDDKKIVIDKEKCIRCYCCHEICPFGAIDI